MATKIIQTQFVQSSIGGSHSTSASLTSDPLYASLFGFCLVLQKTSNCYALASTCGIEGSGHHGYASDILLAACFRVVNLSVISGVYTLLNVRVGYWSAIVIPFSLHQISPSEHLMCQSAFQIASIPVKSGRRLTYSDIVFHLD